MPRPQSWASRPRRNDSPTLRHQLHLDQSPIGGYLSWAKAALHGDFGTSLTQGVPVWDIVAPRLANSIVLIVLTAIISTILGVLLGMWAAARRDSWIDHSLSVTALVASSLPEFVVAVFVVMVFAVTVFAWFPAVSILPEGEQIWDEPNKLVLPVLALVIVVTPYVFRMFRASLIEALSSDYVEVATLKGASTSRLLFGHALPNALAATIQVVGLNLLYLAGGIALVETVFQYPGNRFDARRVDHRPGRADDPVPGRAAGDRLRPPQHRHRRGRPARHPASSTSEVSP